MVVEDALAGVAAGRPAGSASWSAWRAAPSADELRAAGADIVVGDLAEMVA